MELKFDPLGIGWKSKANRVPISFELFDGVAHLVNYITDRETCAKMKPTDYTAQFLRWQDGQWVELAQTAFPLDRALLNLSEHFWGHTTKEDYRGTVSWEEKRLMGQRSPTDTIKSYFERSQRFCSDYLKI